MVTLRAKRKLVSVQGSFRGERVGTPLPIVKVSKNALWTELRTIFCPKNALDCRVLHIQSLDFSEGDTPPPPDPRRSVPGAWAQTTISAWLASVPSVPVLRNDYCVCLGQRTGGASAGYRRKNSEIVLYIRKIPQSDAFFAGKWFAMPFTMRF